MEKLIELLNEFIKEKKHYHWTFEDENDVSKYDCLIIFKQFGFIKWLVENEKINVHGIPEFYHISDHCLECAYEGIADNTIMLLSIQDEPIEFLVSILK